jgi:hypothetical protein
MSPTAGMRALENRTGFLGLPARRVVTISAELPRAFTTIRSYIQKLHMAVFEG